MYQKKKIKYYRFGTKSNFRFIVKEGVSNEIISKFYNPSRFWAQWALRFRLYLLFLVDENEMKEYMLLDGKTDFLLRGNNVNRQKYISYMLSGSSIRKWSKNKNGIMDIQNECMNIQNINIKLKNIILPDVISSFFSEDYSYVDIKFFYEKQRNPAIDDLFIKTYFNEYLNQKSGEYVFSHCDLTPWNVLSNQGVYMIIDWELASLTPMYYDLIYYYYSWFKLGRNKSHEDSLAMSKKKIESLQLIENEEFFADSLEYFKKKNG
jgi:hypothetical protein